MVIICTQGGNEYGTLKERKHPNSGHFSVSGLKGKSNVISPTIHLGVTSHNAMSSLLVSQTQATGSNSHNNDKESNSFI